MKNFGVYRYIALIFTLLVVSTAVWGQVYIWDGGPGPASASIAGNWLPVGVPGAGDTAQITYDAQIEIPAGGPIGTVIVDAGCTVEFIIQAGTLTVETQLQNNGNLTIIGPGNLTVSGTANTGTLTIGAGGARNLGPLTNDGTLAVGTNTVTTGSITGNGEVTVSTGTINAGGTSSIDTLTVSGGPAILNGTGVGLTVADDPGGAIATTGTVILQGTNFTSITNTGTLSFTNAANFSGSITNSGALTFNNTATLSGNMNLTAGSLTLGGAVSVGGNWTDSGATLTHNGNAVSFTGAGNQSFTPGANTYDAVIVNKATGTFTVNTNDLECNSLTITNSAGCTFNTAVTAPVLTLTATTGTIAFLDDLSVSTTFSNTGGNFAVNLYGSTTQMPAADFLTSGTVRLGNGGLPTDTLTFTGGFAHAGNTALNGTLETTSTPVSIAALTLGGTTEINTSGGNINISGPVTNTAAQDLTLNAGAGDIVLPNAVGGGINLNDVSLIGANITLGTGGGVNAGGTVTITNTGLLTINDRTSPIDIGTWDIVAGGGFIQAGGGGVRLSGDISAPGNDITFAAAPELFGHVALSTGGLAGGDIEFNHAGTAVTHDGTARNLILTAGDGSVQFVGSVAVPASPLGLLTINSATGGITANNTINAQTVSLTGGTVVLDDTVTASGGFSSTGTDFSNGGTITTTDTNITINHTGAITIAAGLSSGNGNISVGAVAAGTITLSDATPVTTTGGNITFNRPVTLTVDAVISTGAVGGNIAFGANSSINGTFLLELEAGTGTVGLASTVGDTDPLTSLIVSSATTATFQENVTTSGTGIDVTATTINLRGLTMTAGTDPAAGITLTGSVALLDDAVSLEATDDISITGAVSGAQTLTINNANDVTFGDTITVANLVQSLGGGTTTFTENVTTSGATGIAINTTNIVLDGLTMTAGTNLAADIALTGVVTLSTADVVLSAQDAITLGGTVDGDQSLTVNCNGYFVTAEDADITLIGASFTKTGNGISKLSGGISTTDAGTITFNTALLPADVYLLGSAVGAMTLACGNVDTAIVINGNLFVGETNLPVKEFNFGSGLQATNCVLMHGTITLAPTTGIPALSTTQDLVLLGSGYNIADPDTGIGNLFSYVNVSRAGATAPTHTTIPTTAPGGPVISATYSTTIATTLPGKTLSVDGNFYANGVDLNPGAAWTLSIPDNDNALASFAEAYNLTLANCTVTNNTGTFARLAAANATDVALTNTNCAFSRPVILADDGTQDTGDPLSGTYTVYDDVIRVELVDSITGALAVIENSNNEISAAVASIQYLSDGTLVSFANSYTGPDCATGTDGAGDIIGVFYLRTVQGTPERRWNTDATGTSTGALDSTDRGRPLPLVTAPAHRNSVPCIDLPAALGTVFQTIRDANKNRITHTSEDRTPINGTRFIDTADRCRPVLVEVRTGQELHENILGNQRPYDAHNFIELRYSEEVNIGGFATAPTVGGITYAKAMTDFTLATDWGGAISGSGPLTIAGYASIASGTLVTGTRGSHATPAPAASDPTVHALYREFSLDGAAAPVNQPHRLRISIAGWCETLAPSFFWQGFITSAVSPSGIVTVPSNQFIRDQAATPNILEPTIYDLLTETSTGTAWYGNFQNPQVLKAAVSVNSTEADLYSNWDTTPPAFAALRTYTDNWDDPLSAYELNPLASPGGLVNRIEMHFYDNRIDYSNPSETWKWQSRTGWYETTTATIEHPAPENFGGARPDRQHTGPFPTQPTSGGIRDSSFHNVSSAFVITNISGPTATGTDITDFTTAVNSPFFNILATLNVDNDPYITLHLDDVALGWPIATASISVTYTNWIDDNINGGFVTDLAGNLLGTQTGMQALDRTPPEVTVSIAGANRDELYLVFSKEIGTGTTVWDGIVVHLENPAIDLTPTAVETRPGSDQVLFFRLPAPITADQLIDPASEIRFLPYGPLVPNPETGFPEAVTAYSDTMGNYVSLAETHRITDIAVGLVDILYASDGVNTDGIFGSNEGALRVFDGTGRLLDRNLTIATHLSNETAAPLALTMYYDASAPAASFPGLFNSATGLTSRLWLPGVQPGFNTQGNPAARALGPDQILDADRLFRNFAISEADEDMVPGSDIDILFRYGDLYCARLEDPADISSVAPWTIGIAETKRQRGGVTILNNVIDSRRRERTIVQVEVPKAGNIVIQVFTLDGNTVKVLERGRKGAGTYQYFWDGTNNGGRPVARGMYFIRVVGPDIDEIRKVMVVKE